MEIVLCKELKEGYVLGKTFLFFEKDFIYLRERERASAPVGVGGGEEEGKNPTQTPC